MHTLFAGIHLQNKPNEFLPLAGIDFEKNVLYLKEQIAGKLEYDAANLELIYNGSPLSDSAKLAAALRPNSTVHCFQKTKKYAQYQSAADTNSETAIARVQELFNVIAHIQINVNSRVTILQKILAEYPEFRRNLGAQALIRDSVLFNTLHQPEVIKNIAENYPIICEAAPYIVDTIKKELTRNTSTSTFSEPATDSTNSSEEENSLGASSSNERTSAASEASSSGGGTTTTNQSENARIRMISRQQLQAALAQISFGSVNSLSNIAQRNSDPLAPAVAAATPGTTAPLSNSASGERISSELFRSALNSLTQRAPPTSATTTTATEHMDTVDPLLGDGSSPNLLNDSLDDGIDGDVPACYRTHQYVDALRTMAQMGFVNYEENLTYLNITNGNIENAINLLMGSMN